MQVRRDEAPIQVCDESVTAFAIFHLTEVDIIRKYFQSVNRMRQVRFRLIPVQK